MPDVQPSKKGAQKELDRHGLFERCLKDSIIITRGSLTRARLFGVRVPAVNEGGDVVIPVQENQVLLSQDDENGVTQFRKLAQREQQNPES